MLGCRITGYAQPSPQQQNLGSGKVTQRALGRDPYFYFHTSILRFLLRQIQIKSIDIMSIEKEVEIYTYTLSVISLQLKVKFPCKIYLEHAGSTITTEVPSSSPNKFVFNQQITIKNQTDKDYIEVIVNLLTDKGAKYVGGVLKFVESELIGSQGERIVVPVNKCLDAQAVCEIRVDQVATSRVARKVSPKKRNILKSQYQPDMNLVSWNSQKNKISNEGQTKSEYNFPLTVNRSKVEQRKQPTIAPSAMRKTNNRANDIGMMDREPMTSMAGVSGVQFEVYKEGYNKLKEKYRKQAQTARSQMNKRMILESNQSNMKLELMRYKLKNEQLQKSVLDKNIKIKELTQSISNFQKKELDTKYLKEEVQNKNYTIRNLEETIKTLSKDNAQLKNIQNLRAQSEQETIRSLKDQVEKLKRQLDTRQSDLARQIRSKNDIITKKEYEIHTKSEQLERAKCSIQDLQKSISNKTFEWQKIQQSQRAASKTRQDELRQKIAKAQAEKAGVQQKLKNTQQLLQEKRGELVKVEYDKKVSLQNNESLQKENQELRIIRERYVELVREHKLVGQEKVLTEKNKDRQLRLKETQIQDLTQRFNALSENSKKSTKELQEKLKGTQMKLVESESQNQLYKNQLEKAKRQNELLNKEIVELKNQIKDLRTSVKEKQDRFLNLTNQLADSKNRSKQGDYSSKLQLERLRQDNQKLLKNLEEQKTKSKQYYQAMNKLELDLNKNKMEGQFKEERALKELTYAKEKITSLQTFKQDLESQVSAANTSIANLKNSQKVLNEKIQKMELQAIKSRQQFQKAKKEQKILQQKVQNHENTIKVKLKQINEHLEAKEGLEKHISTLQGQMSQLKNDFNKETNEKSRNQKIVQILQGDLTKAKQEQTRLNGVIASREKVEQELRQQIKKQKEESTKLDMRLSALKKETDKFKDTLVDNLYSVFSSIPDGSGGNSPLRPSKSTIGMEKAKENAQILSILTTLGKDARSNMAKVVDQLKIAQRDHEKLNTEYSTTVNKCNTTEFEYNQTISRLEDEISEILAQKQTNQNKYEEQVFMLESRIKDKEETINDLTQQVEELDFTYKNTRAELDAFRDDMIKKDNNRCKTIDELREQIEYHLTTISLLQNNLEKLQQELELTQNELGEKNDRIYKFERQLSELKESSHEVSEQASTLKRQLKKANEKCEQLSIELASQKDEAEKLRLNVEDEQKKSGELRQFLNGLMKQKQQIIKKQLEKSQQILEFETKIEQLKHENERYLEDIKKYKKLEEEFKENLKKSAKALKQEENAKLQQRNKCIKLSEKVKDKEKEIASKDDSISKLQEKLKKEKQKLGKDIKELEQEIDETYEKLLTKEKESNERILFLESQNQKLKMECEKIKDLHHNSEEGLFSEKSKLDEKNNLLSNTEKQLAQATERIKNLQEKIRQFEEEFNIKEEQTFKLQGKIYSLEGKLEQKENEKNDKLQNLHSDWQSKFDSMCEEYEQRLELAEKQKEFLKQRNDEKQKEIKKLSNELKMQQNNISILKKSYEEKVKALEEDRLVVLAQKNTENQRLVEESRINFENLKAKQSQARRLVGDLELSKTTITKLQAKIKQNQEKIKNLNRTYLTEVQQFKKKEQTFKRLKENVASSIWKSQREVRRVVQNGIKKILEVVDEQNTMKVIEATKPLQQSIVSAISIKLQEKQQ